MLIVQIVILEHGFLTKTYIGNDTELVKLLLLVIWQSSGLPGWQKVNIITVTSRPHHPSTAAGFVLFVHFTRISPCSLREVKWVLLYCMCI